ncbi:Hypothetical predicted protein [Podarcis lilfordi]|uniref:Uncharacterized protein n=1 Tax=Podarcis lilfordi TaxID=74358 RepID=A0AA35PHT6_9SAUR|nr:Hypothetical predicted protein [Podarcis lilfordi]
MRSIPEIQEEGRISGLVLCGTEWLRRMRSFLQVKRSNKVAPLHHKEPPVTPVVTKLFMTVPKPEKAIAQRHQSRVRPAPEEEDIITEDL